MKKTIILVVVVSIILGLGYFFFQSSFADFMAGKAFLSVTTNTPTTVSLNNEVMGTAPYSAENLPAKDYLVTLTHTTPVATTAPSATPTAAKVSWESNVRLTPNTQTVINQEVGPSSLFSSGEILSLEKGEGLTVITKPEKVSVSLDGGDALTSPFSTAVSVGNHKLKLSKSGYFSREITINVPSGFRLIVNAQLALNPLEGQQKLESVDKITLFRFPTEETSLWEDNSSWALGVWYFQEKYIPTNPKIDLILDSDGNTYYASTSEWVKKQTEKKEIYLGYLARSSEAGLTEAAKKKYDEIKNTFAPPKTTVKISNTPTGWLNVRSGAGQSNSVVTKVNPGESYELLEEKSGWYKIKLSDGKEGWISSQYASK